MCVLFEYYVLSFERWRLYLGYGASGGLVEDSEYGYFSDGWRDRRKYRLLGLCDSSVIIMYIFARI